MAYPFFSVGLHNPHSHPRTLSSWVTIAKVALLFIVVSPTAGSHTLYYHSMACGQLIPILSGHTFLCNPWGTSSYTTFSTNVPIHHHGDTYLQLSLYVQLGLHPHHLLPGGLSVDVTDVTFPGYVYIFPH